ncbi:hypothetical protein, partial [Vibrio campbellii]|uniref:hypothetical protein n=1 Tax=Vibrio campbellii TaxID=680 RepID=UPI0015E3152E
NSDASGISSTTLSQIIGLTFDSANVVDYQSAIAAEASIADVAALQALIDSVDASAAAFVNVQSAATSSDASTLTVDTLGAIRGLAFNGANFVDYQSAIATETSIADVAALQALIDSVDASLAAFAAVQAAATSSDASVISSSTLSGIIGLTFDSANLTDYQGAIAAEISIADVAALQALIDGVDASLVAFAVIQNAVASSDASNVSVETFRDIRGLNLIEANVADYQQAIEREIEIADVVALQTLVDSVDASIVALANVQLAATKSDASSLTVDTLSAIRGLSFDSVNLADYQGAIAAESSIADVAALQVLIDSVDASVLAFAAVQLAATNSDASSINATLLAKIRGLTFTSGHILDYRSAIESETVIADVAALQALINRVDTSLAAFATVQAAATSSDASGISSTTLSNIIGLTFDNINLTDYQGAIAAEASIADVLALQTLIDSVDASITAFSAVQLAATNSDASGISSTTLSDIIGFTFDSVNLSDYQGAIATEASITDVAALQALIDSVDASLA